MSAAYLVPDLRVTVVTLDHPNAPRPLPIYAGFPEGGSYLVLGIIEHDPDGELWLILANPAGQIWRLSNRHVRIVRERQESAEDQAWREAAVKIGQRQAGVVRPEDWGELPGIKKVTV
jgi:hypothetical protein